MAKGVGKPKFRAIVPRDLDVAGVVGLEGRITKAMRDVGAGTVQVMKDSYPAQKATTYRRTGGLGRGWSYRGPRRAGNNIEVRVGNDRKHAPFVQGLKTLGKSDQQQIDPFPSYGWSSLEDIMNEQLQEHKPKILAALRGKTIL